MIHVDREDFLNWERGLFDRQKHGNNYQRVQAQLIQASAAYWRKVPQPLVMTHEGKPYSFLVRNPQTNKWVENRSLLRRELEKINVIAHRQYEARKKLADMESTGG